MCSLALGTRAPIVFSVTPSDGNCAVPQDVLISGACFTFQELVPGVGLVTRSVTSVFAVEQGTGRVVNATSFVILNPNLIDAFFNFGTGTGTRTFRMFVTGPGGTSRNLTSLPAGSPAGCPLGNEQGNAVTFTCNPVQTGCPPNIPSPGCPCPPGVPAGTNGCTTSVPVPLVNGCNLLREASGAFKLEVFGRNIKEGATVTIAGQAPGKVKFKDRDPQNSEFFTRITVKKRICRVLPGLIIVTNPPAGPNLPGVPSAAFLCDERCPTN